MLVDGAHPVRVGRLGQGGSVGVQSFAFFSLTRNSSSQMAFSRPRRRIGPTLHSRYMRSGYGSICWSMKALVDMQVA